jgi:tRNA pseudouridine32 synthase/23S rRNA pseudouridine746 synthase
MLEFTYDPPAVPLTILHADAALLVLDKPAGLLSVPGKTAGREDCLIARLQAVHPEALLVHRLDCDTSGVMVFARTKAAQGHLGKQFEARGVGKTYVARVAGRVAGEAGRIDLPIGVDWPNRPRQKVDPEHGRAAETGWAVIARGDGETRLRLSPRTGRSHQLRVHLAALGHPILGDPIYSADAAAWPRMMLHAETLRLRHPVGGAWVDFAAACPF